MPDLRLIQPLSQRQILPWQQDLWQKLPLQPADKFPHALLISGINGIGKKVFSFYLSKALLCLSPEPGGEPCHHCKSCQLFAAGSHPDFNHLGITEGKKIIPVDRIREVINWSFLSTQSGRKKILLIEPADAMNINAANSLLKTLEEPVANTVIMLVTARKQALLPTIRSRCQACNIQLADSQIALDWLTEQGVDRPGLMLSLASGAPLKALEISSADHLQTREMIIEQLMSVHTQSKDPVSVAEHLHKLTRKPQAMRVEEILYWFESIIIDMVRIQYNCEPLFITNNDLYVHLKRISDGLYLKKVMQLTDYINKAYHNVQGQINSQLLLEDLLISWQQCRL